jgi:ferredoxin
MRIEADGQKCIGAGQCVATAPEVFDQREDDGTVVLLTEKPSAEHLAAVQEAVMVCHRVPSGWLRNSRRGGPPRIRPDPAGVAAALKVVVVTASGEAVEALDCQLQIRDARGTT